MQRSTVQLFALFILWGVITGLRAIYTEPLEFGWIVGIVGTTACAFAAGYVWRAIRPARLAAFRRKWGLDG